MTVKLLESPKLKGTSHGFFTRLGGVSAGVYSALNFDTREEGPENVSRNIEIASNELGLPLDRLVTVNQVHGDIVYKAFGKDERPDADAIVTDTPGLPIGILTADCLPIILFDPANCVASIVHAGWKGSAMGVAGRAVSAMKAAFDTEAGDIIAALGPYIGPCCYEVDEKVRAEFKKNFDYSDDFFEERGNGLRLDIGKANAAQLKACGVKEENICLENAVCTACNPSLFFSYRRDNGRTGRQLSFIILKGTTG